MLEQEKRRQGRPKSAEKRALILSAASKLFLKEGFTTTSMDRVAKESGVSKQTVYSHFSCKDSLFQAAITNKCKAYQLDSLQIDSASHNQTLEQYLTQVGSQFIRLLQDPDAVAVYRVIIAEAPNSSHVADLFHQTGPKASLDTLATAFKSYGKDKLSDAQSLQLAYDFCGLLKGEFHMLLLCGLATPMTEPQIAAHVSDVVAKIICLFEYYWQTSV